MVGIAGRSKGCSTCYRRHLKCDEARPVCRRCTTARIECMGYRDTTFISFEAGDAGPRRFGSNTSELRTLRVIHRTTQPSPTLFIPCPPDDNMCISYARMHLPTTWQEEVHWQVHESKNVAKKPELEDNLPQCALISLARVLFAQRFQQADLLQKGLSLYSQVLSAVNKALGQPDCGQRLEVLDAVVALRAFDSFIPYNQNAWVQHSLGIEKLLELRGSDAHTSHAARRSFDRARPFVIMGALATCKPTILAAAQWKIAQESTEVKHITNYQQLMDIFVDLPALVHTTSQRSKSRIRQDEHGRYLQRPAFHEKTLAVELLHMLHRWRQRWNVENATELFPADITFPPRAGIDLPPWTRGLCFSSLENAKIIFTYNTICVMTLCAVFAEEIQTVHHDEGESSCLHFTTVQANLAPIRGDTPASIDFLEPKVRKALLKLHHSALYEVCRSVNYYFVAVAQQNHPIDLLIPLRQIWLATRTNVSDCYLAAWLNDTIYKISADISEGVPLVLSPCES